MNCEEARRLLAASDGDALRHVQTCVDCQVWRMSHVSESVHLRPELEGTIIRAVTTELKPVRAIRSNLASTLFLLSGIAVVVALAIAVLGMRGWASSDIALRAYLGTTIIAGLATGATLLPRLVVPGELLRVHLVVPAASIIAAVLAASLFYSVIMYPDFLRATLTCVSIGSATAVISATIAWAVLRRGFVVSPVWTGAMAGNLCGLSGLTVLFVFCPHLDFWHYLAAHSGMLLLGTAGGAAAGFAWYRSSSVPLDGSP